MLVSLHWSAYDGGYCSKAIALLNAQSKTKWRAVGLKYSEYDGDRYRKYSHRSARDHGKSVRYSKTKWYCDVRSHTHPRKRIAGQWEVEIGDIGAILAKTSFVYLLLVFGTMWDGCIVSEPCSSPERTVFAAAAAVRDLLTGQAHSGRFSQCSGRD